MTLDDKVNLVVKQIVEALYILRYGKTIQESTDGEAEEGVKASADYALNYIEDYIKEKFGVKDSIRFKAAHKHGDYIDEKWPYVGEEIFEAIDALSNEINTTVANLKTKYDSN